MAAFPQLIEEDFELFKASLERLRSSSRAHLVLLVEKAGYLIHQIGEVENVDATQLAALASNCFNATLFIASLIRESNFNTMYQQGDSTSMLILNVDDHCLIVALFDASISAGSVRFYAASAIEAIATQLARAGERNPEGAISIVDMNPSDIRDVFQRRSADPA
jgi:predicted regulator of Ras-like GTPase activity (Roadblock/LC7/MglB family)